ncbi:MAG: integrase core domain-containing protein [Planctomycetota bacterium]
MPFGIPLPPQRSSPRTPGSSQATWNHLSGLGQSQPPPNQNAFVERCMGSIKHECLDHFIAFGLGHLDLLVNAFAEHYHRARPHQRTENKPLVGVSPDLDDPPDRPEQVVCHESLGGVLKHYGRSAA